MTSLRLIGAWHPATILACALLLSGLAFWLYRLQLRHHSGSISQWLLPTLRALAVFLITLTLAEPAIESRRRDGEPSRVKFILDGSLSMSIGEPVSSSRAHDLATANAGVGTPIADGPLTGPSRFQRATQILVGADGLLARLREQFALSVVRWDENGPVELWNSQPGSVSPDDDSGYQWGPDVWAESSPLGDALAHALTNRTVETSAKLGSDEILVLLSDGQSNAGIPPADVIHQLREQGTKLFTVGLASFQPHPDLALRQLSLPDRLYRTDALSGTVTVAQTLTQGEPFTLQIEHAGKIVWSQEEVATDQEQRTIPFAFPVNPLFEQACSKLSTETQVNRLPLKLTARIITRLDRDNNLNNARDAYCLVVSEKGRVLLIDGRARWESRYLKNMFTRDPSWLIDSILLASSAKQTNLPDQGDQASSMGSSSLPATREELFKYDLVILGEPLAGALSEVWLEWLREFVERGGGGLIIVDGSRETLRDTTFETLHRMSPIRWSNRMNQTSSSLNDRLVKRPQLTTTGQQLEALRLTAAGAEENVAIWSQMAPLEFVTQVEAIPTADVLIEASNQLDRWPLLITHRYGAGRVLFWSTDETWRWRLGDAEPLHSRLWLQLSRWAMKMPFSLRGEFMSLDTGMATYQPNQSIPVRCQLRTIAGLPAAGQRPTAVVTMGGQTIATIPLAEESISGNYSSQLAPLPSGDYQLRIAAPEYSREALSLESNFSIVDPQSEEMQNLTCDEGSLSNWAEQTNGKYLRESEAGEIIQLVEPLVQGKITSSVWLLWQSYVWFTAAMLLLTAEWLVRKQQGLT